MPVVIENQKLDILTKILINRFQEKKGVVSNLDLKELQTELKTQGFVDEEQFYFNLEGLLRAIGAICVSCPLCDGADTTDNKLKWYAKPGFLGKYQCGFHGTQYINPWVYLKMMSSKSLIGAVTLQDRVDDDNEESGKQKTGFLGWILSIVIYGLVGFIFRLTFFPIQLIVYLIYYLNINNQLKKMRK